MYLLLAIHIAWTLGAVPLVTRQKRLPASAAAWLALILLLPVAGTLLYVLAGYRPHLPAAERRAYRGDRLGQIIARGCGTRITRHNSVELLHNGNNAFTALIASLQRAVRSIHMEYYIIRDDRIGRTIAEILIRKARVGLEVRVIYDAVGSWRLSRTTLRRMHDRPGSRRVLPPGPRGGIRPARKAACRRREAGRPAPARRPPRPVSVGDA